MWILKICYRLVPVIPIYVIQQLSLRRLVMRAPARTLRKSKRVSLLVVLLHPRARAPPQKIRQKEFHRFRPAGLGSIPSHLHYSSHIIFIVIIISLIPHHFFHLQRFIMRVSGALSSNIHQAVLSEHLITFRHPSFWCVCRSIVLPKCIIQFIMSLVVGLGGLKLSY